MKQAKQRTSRFIAAARNHARARLAYSRLHEQLDASVREVIVKSAKASLGIA